MHLEEGRIEAARFLAYGCAPTVVCGSILTELITGKSIADVLQLTRKDLDEAAGGLPLRKQHAAALAIQTLRVILWAAVLFRLRAQHESFCANHGARFHRN
ncbi:MAG: iron-sulfur cluster assembly scaffold protein [Pyrinomonadaceae bacterium]